jgi:hypothetical protein
MRSEQGLDAFQPTWDQICRRGKEMNWALAVIMSNAGLDDLVGLSCEGREAERKYREVERYGEAKRNPIRDSVIEVQRCS